MMQQRPRATNAAPPARNSRKVLSPSLSDTSDEIALPTRLVSGGAARRVGGVNDNDYETSSYEETETCDGSFSDNSEEYVPLAFGYINSNPRRRAGAPAPSHAPSGVSEEADAKESTSFSDIPLEVFLQHDRTKRWCGKGAKDLNRAEVASSLSFHDDEGGASSTTSASLPVEFERRKRTRVVGKVKASKYEVSEAESSVSLADEDEVPLNAQLIHTLIKRLRNSADEVSLEAFDFVDFNDKNFKEELAPLKKIQALLAEKASNPIVASAKRNREIKEAVQSLPPVKAVAAKVKAIKSRQIRSSLPHDRLLHGEASELEKAEAIAKLVRELQDPKAAVQLRAFDEVDWNDRNFDPVLAPLQQIRAYMEAKGVALAKPAEGKMGNVSALDAKIKTAILALPSEEAMAATVNAVKDRALSSDPSNGDAIRSLVARLKEPGQAVQRCEFDKLDWNDTNFRRELEPLQQIRAFLEAKDVLQQRPNENVLTGPSSLDDHIKMAILSLPTEKAMAAKVATVRSRELKAKQGKGRTALGGEAAAENAEAIAKLVRELQDPKAAVQLRAFDEVDWNDRNFDPVLAPLQQIRAYMEAKGVALAKPAEGKMGNVSALDAKIKTAILALPSEEAMAATVNAVKDRALSSDPSNGDAIRSLVVRLKEPGQAVQRCEFDKLDWNDTNFRRELEPLQQIRAFLEVKEVLQQRPNENVLERGLDLDKHIKMAILSLPTEKAIAVKTQMLKMRQMPESIADGPQQVKTAKISAPASTTKKLTDSLIMANPTKRVHAKEGKLSASNSQLMQVGARVISSQLPKYETKESSALSAAPKKLRRTRSACGRSVSFSKIEDAAPGEIVDKDQELAESTGAQPLRDGPRPPDSVRTSQRVSRVPSRPVGVKKPERHPRNRRQNNVSFGSIPNEAAEVIAEEEEQLANTKRKAARRRGPHRLGRSISITSLPDVEAGELVEEPTLAASKLAMPSTTRSVTPAATEKPRRPRPARPSSSTQFDQASEEVAEELGDGNTTLRNATVPNPDRRKRRAKVGGKNNRSCSFLDVGDVEAQEIPDSNEAQLKGVGAEGESARQRKGKKLLRRRRPGGEGASRALEFSNPAMTEAGEVQETAAGSQAPVKGRRSNVHRPRSANASIIVDAEAGEIVERPDETSVLCTPSRTITPFLDEPIAKRPNGTGMPPKSQRLSRGPSDLGATGRRRRQRMHLSKELSISAIPDNAAGEIVENAPTSLASSVNGMLSLGNGTTLHHLPRVGRGSERLFARSGQPPSGASLRSSTEGRRDLAMPRTDTAFMSDPLPSAPLKPSAALRRSAESTPRSGAGAATKSAAVGNQRVPPVRALS